MELRVVFMGGDGVGPEVTRSAIAVLQALGDVHDFTLTVDERPIGWQAVEAEGTPLPPATLQACEGADAAFLGAVGAPEADRAPPELRPERGLLELRQRLGCWANLRPTVVPSALAVSSPLRADLVEGVDLLIVRELAGGLYYGEPRSLTESAAENTLRYTRSEIERIARLAFEAAAGRRRRLVSIDKANVLEVSRLWRSVVSDLAPEWPGVTLEHMLVDRAAMELVLRPGHFDVIVTTNLFGDVLSDLAAALAGSLGVAGSASLGGTTDLYEPVHGSAPDLAGRGEANPMGAMATVSLMLRHTFALHDAADHLDRAIARTLEEGSRTPDLAGAHATEPVSTVHFTDHVIRSMRDTA